MTSEKASERLWRTLIRLEYKAGDHFVAVLPGWDPHEEVNIPATTVPSEFHDDDYVFAWANIGAEKADELRYERFEKVPPLTKFATIDRPDECFNCGEKMVGHPDTCVMPEYEEKPWT